ncbi:MAG: hypothetical protein JKY49_17390 [Cohaesibacteraceae bacterium]|nr:hypothetical protein [Cohaesibacteraceae bacterium]MBL4876817.1 hypothetical protein [Cohaesibacteraceae bacterium]
MRLSAPTQLVFLISLVLIILSIVSMYVTLPVIGGYTLWLAIAAYGVLFCGNILKGL